MSLTAVEVLVFRLLADEWGMQHVEEALLLALIALAAIATISNLGDLLETIFGRITDAIAEVVA
ncbi:MAG: Flp family type IVb pilin [Chloroflexi bacterium]|nr:Flp family type IVb pilin [Chloroflexota bacterium]